MYISDLDLKVPKPFNDVEMSGMQSGSSPRIQKKQKHGRKNTGSKAETPGGARGIGQMGKASSVLGVKPIKRSAQGFDVTESIFYLDDEH